MPAPDVITLCECLARDGLQHEPEFIPTDAKVEMIDAFSAAGFRRIEATSFAHPKYVPQFHDAEEVCRRIARWPGVVYKGTCVGLPAARRAVAAVEAGYGLDEISFPIAATEFANKANTGRTIAESRELFREVAALVDGTGMTLTATVSATFGCPSGISTPLESVLDQVEFFLDNGADRLILGDSHGMAYPSDVERTVGTVLERFPDADLICHFHDNRGVALANILAALDLGIRQFDSSFGGTGGHPPKILYTEGLLNEYTGNVATEDLVFLLLDRGYDLGLDLAQLMAASQLVRSTLGRNLESRVGLAGPAPRWASDVAPAGTVN